MAAKLGTAAPAGAAKTKVASPKPKGTAGKVAGSKSTAAGSTEKAPAAPKLKAVPPTAPSPLDASGIPSHFPVGALESLSTPTRAGAVFRLDNGFLDGLRLQVRRVRSSDGTPGYELQFRIAGPSRDGVKALLDKKGAKSAPFEFIGADPQVENGRTVLVRNGQTTALSVSSWSSHKAPNTKDSPNVRRLEGKAWTLEFVPNDGPLALRGLVRLALRGDDPTCNAALKEAIDKAGLQPALAPVTEAALERYALMKLLWRRSPKKAKEVAQKGQLSSLKPATLRKVLGELGVSPERMDGLRYEQVAPGHFAVLDPMTAQEMKQAGLRYAYSTVTDPEHVLSILKEGQKATVERWAEGMLIQGMSSMTDVITGGGLGVFSRLVPKNAHGSYWAGRTYKIILKPELLARTDIWGWPGDYYGRGWDLSEQNFGLKLLESVANGASYQTHNEIITPHAIGPEYVACVVATSEADRKKLIQHLEKAGYTPPKGQTLASFVRLAPSIDEGLLSG